VADKQHWIDELVGYAREGLHALVDEERSALQGVVPVGMRVLSKKEQLQKFEGMTPEQHQQIIQEQGEEEYTRYAQAQIENARQLFGDEYAARLLNDLTFMQAGYMNPPQTEI
jgi:hypothetical protein